MSDDTGEQLDTDLQPEVATASNHLVHTKLTVNLTARSVAAMEGIAEMEDSTRTDAVNRALQGYAFLLRIQREGKRGHHLAVVTPFWARLLRLNVVTFK